MEKEYSSAGNSNLETLDKAHNFTDWMYSHVKPHLHGRILEIGSGTGTFSKKLVRDFPEQPIVLSDIDKKYIDNLKKQFNGNNISVSKLNLETKDDFKSIGSFDSAFALNVFEHIEHDVDAINNIYENLNENGTLFILVPAHQFLYNCIDKSIDHYRRYNKKDFLNKIKATKFDLEKLYYFNMLSIPGWYLNGNILKREVFDTGLVSFYNRIVPLMKPIEKHIVRNKIGISLIAVLKK